MNTQTSSARHRYPRAVTTLASLALALPLLATAQTKSASDGIGIDGVRVDIAVESPAHGDGG